MTRQPSSPARSARTRRTRNLDAAAGAGARAGRAPILWTTRPGYPAELEGISPRRQAFNHIVITAADGSGVWLRRHWLLLINAALGTIVGVAVVVPVLYALGRAGIAHRIFVTYHLICDQIPSHSYYLFGYQFALCSRNMAIYGSLLGGSLAYRTARDWLPALDWRLWLLTLLPMALDGGTQFFGWRESNWELRTLTGMIFGLGVCWCVLPFLEEATRAGERLRPPFTIDLAHLRFARQS